MAPTLAIITLGMSRSGTNFLERCLRTGHGYFSFKLGESHSAHPMKGDGLWEFCRAFRDRNLVLVYQSRDHDQTWASIQHIQRVKKGFLAQYSSRAKWDALYERQDHNFEAFEGRLDELRKANVGCTTLRVSYEELGDLEQRKAFLEELARRTPYPTRNAKAWADFFKRKWMRDPVTRGRLRSRMRGRGP